MGEDFVNVRLTTWGAELAAGGAVRIHEGNRPEFAFKAGEVQYVTKAHDWERVLKQQVIGGRPLFEIAPEEVQAKEEAKEKVPPKEKATRRQDAI